MLLKVIVELQILKRHFVHDYMIYNMNYNMACGSTNFAELVK